MTFIKGLRSESFFEAYFKGLVLRLILLVTYLEFYLKYMEGVFLIAYLL